MSFDEFDAELSLPSGNDPSENAVLTLTVNYTQNFAFPNEWDQRQKDALHQAFLQCERFWSNKFILITPKDLDYFDFTTSNGPGWICRPNIVCRLKLRHRGAPEHLRLKVYHEQDLAVRGTLSVDRTTGDLYSNIAETLDVLNITASLNRGQQTLITRRPTGVAAGLLDQKMVLLQDGMTWLEVVAKMTETSQSEWQLSMPATQMPRRMPLGFVVRGVMPTIW